jgi:hypothetical protein
MRQSSLIITRFIVVILLSIPNFSFAQKPANTYNYTQKWEKVDSLIDLQLPESAQILVDEIYTSSKTKNNTEQFIKSLIYIIKICQIKDDDAIVRIINRVQNEIKTAESPSKQILHSMLAEIYWTYYNQNRYNFIERSNTVNFQNNDIKTWSLDKILGEIQNNYLLSLENPELLTQIKSTIYPEIIKKTDYYTKSDPQPTLYDFLAQRAINYFTNAQSEINKPANTFYINTIDFLRDSEDFVKLNINSNDSLSNKYRALKLYQDMIRFHLNDTTPEALFEVNLKRLQFVYQNLTLTNKDSLYNDALLKLDQKYTVLPLSSHIKFLIAQNLSQTGNKYKPLLSDSHKWDIKKAYDLCQSAIDKYPNSDGAANAYNLQKRLLNKSLSVQTEKYNIPNQPFKALISYRNIKRLYCRIIKLTPSEIQKQRNKWNKNYNVNREQKFIEYFLGKDFVSQDSTLLPDDGDMQQHSTEMKLNSLPTGNYMIIFSANIKFDADTNGIAYSFTYVSDISYLIRDLNGKGTQVLLTSRSTGEPLANVIAQVYFNFYNPRNSEYSISKENAYTSNKEGIVYIPYQNFNNSKRNSHGFFINFKLKNDSISTKDIDGQSNYNGLVYQNEELPELSQTRTAFFLDRVIYRPGQTLFFKGLVYSRTNKKTEIVPQKKYTVTFYNVNGQVVTTKDVTTNEYGTFNGTFTTPATGLTGDMWLRINDDTESSTSFSVEEYKRPKFEVLFKPISGNYRLNDSVIIKGNAKSYAGANIDGAQVKYRVERQSIYPVWWNYCYGFHPATDNVEITNGQTLTLADGTFEIPFKAIPDEEKSLSHEVIFNYNVYADVTDINGETHSSQTVVKVGYQSLQIKNMANDIDLARIDSASAQIPVFTTNLSDNPVKANLNIKISRLKSPGKAYRERLGERPDRQILSKNDYYKFFPFDAYSDENNFYKWEKSETVLEKIVNTGAEKSISLDDLRNWKTGKYILEINATDSFGVNVKDISYFDITNSKLNQLPYPEIDLFEVSKTTAEPGESINITTGSSENISALLELEKDGRIVESRRIAIKNELQSIKLPIKEEYRGNFVIHYTFILNNRKYTNSQLIEVPWSNKQFDIKFETFRDKLQPGEKEQWKLHLKGKLSDKISAEMVAAMYDASLDNFKANSWNADFFPLSYSELNWDSHSNFDSDFSNLWDDNWNYFTPKTVNNNAYSLLNWYGVSLRSFMNYGREEVLYEMTAAPVRGSAKKTALTKDKNNTNADEESGYLNKAEVTELADIRLVKNTQPNLTVAPQPVIRKNFNETAFFYPNLETNEDGDIIINFTVPEALTRWKMLGFAHTKELSYGFITNQLVTQKTLMVMPNSPRFFRENDKMSFAVKITSMNDKPLEGEATLEFFDALTMKPVNDLLKLKTQHQTFSVKANQSTNLEWNIEIPEGLQALTYRVTAQSGNFSDGEENTLPVVTNKMLVTETLPLPIRSNQTKTFTFDKLLNNTSTTLKSQRFTLEFTSNPAWYAIQALPYLMEYPYECTEQTFSRFYANSIASFIANSNPKIKQVFDTWANLQPDALLSNLEKNQELKTAILEETPWVLNAKDENERKRNVALLFDLNRMGNESEKALKKIKDAQSSNGGFSWFPGLKENIYFTQHIIAGLGHLDVLGVIRVREKEDYLEMLSKALNYADNSIYDRYNYIDAQAKKGTFNKDEYQPDYIEIQYLYARSYFQEITLEKKYQEAYHYFEGQAKKYWTKYSVYMQGMIAFALSQTNDKVVPEAIIRSLKERALHSEEMGMYWKSEAGFYWYQAPIETQSLLIELFDRVAHDAVCVDEMQTWLLKQKQTQDWKTTKATSEACYALLLRGTDKLTTSNSVEIKVGNKTISPATQPDIKTEAGTGYFKTAWTASEITPDMGKITLTKTDDGVAWGAAYWQYFEQLDKITSAETPLKIDKKLFLEQNTDRGPVITPITETTHLKPGDLIKVRIEIRADRNMEFIQLKDMRAAGLEPVQTLSSYKYQDGLCYYENPRDMAVNFFIDWMPKGTYVFEYPLRVSQKGDFSNGITTIQCMYAPEFASHSEGIRVRVQ